MENLIYVKGWLQCNL